MWIESLGRERQTTLNRLETDPDACARFVSETAGAAAEGAAVAAAEEEESKGNNSSSAAKRGTGTFLNVPAEMIFEKGQSVRIHR